MDDDPPEPARRLSPIRYVFCFENHGEDIGVTLTHPHGQIYGYPFVPPRFARMTGGFGGCVIACCPPGTSRPRGRP